MEEKIVTFLLRLPESLKARIEEAAKHDRRSIHSEVLVLLESALEARSQ